MLVDKIKLIIPVLTALALICSAAVIYTHISRLTPRERRRLFSKRNLLSFSSFLIALTIGFLYAGAYHICADSNAAAIISLSFADASLGHNPNGSRFNMSGIISDEVLERAIERGALTGLSVGDLSESLSITPTVRGNSYSKDSYHISTEYYLNYYASRKTRKYNPSDILTIVAGAYKELYIEKYVESFDIVDDNMRDKFAAMDYADISTYLDKEIYKILNYMYELAEKNPSFVSSNGSTFASVAAKIWQFNTTNLSGTLNSYLLQNGITKNKGDYMSRLKYNITELSFDKKRADASYDICRRAIAMYSDDMARIVLVPTRDDSGKYYMGRTKVGVDEIASNGVSYSDTSVKYKKQIDDNKLVLSKLEASKTYGDDSTADKLIDSICDDIYRFEAEAVEIGNEYYTEKLNQCIMTSIVGTSIVKTVFFGAFMTVFSYFAAVSLHLARILTPKSKKKQVD